MARIARHDPRRFVQANASLRLAPLVATPAMVRDLFFSDSTPDELVKACHRRVQDESYRAFLDMLALDLVKTERVNRVPMLVLGTDSDPVIFSDKQVRRTAAAYGAEVEVLSGIGHDMMLEPGWGEAAERIHIWLTSQGL